MGCRSFWRVRYLEVWKLTCKIPWHQRQLCLWPHKMDCNRLSGETLLERRLLVSCDSGQSQDLQVRCLRHISVWISCLCLTLFFEAGSFKMSLFAKEITCCLLGSALVARMNIFLAPDTGFLSSCFLVSWFWLRLVPLVLDPFPCDYFIGSCACETSTWVLLGSSNFRMVASMALFLREQFCMSTSPDINVVRLATVESGCQGPVFNSLHFFSPQFELWGCIVWHPIDDFRRPSWFHSYVIQTRSI